MSCLGEKGRKKKKKDQPTLLETCSDRRKRILDFLRQETLGYVDEDPEALPSRCRKS